MAQMTVMMIPMTVQGMSSATFVWRPVAARTIHPAPPTSPRPDDDEDDGHSKVEPDHCCSLPAADSPSILSLYPPPDCRM